VFIIYITKSDSHGQCHTHWHSDTRTYCNSW